MVPRLLIVDDTDPIRTCLVDYVRAEMGDSVEIVEACNGKEAIEAIMDDRRKRFAGVLTDFNMPYFNGAEVANAAFGIQVPNVVIMTAQYRENLIRACGKEAFAELQTKGLKVVHKPFDFVDIQRAVIDPIRKTA